MINKNKSDTLRGLAFLSPNILGFLTFTIFPLAFSIVMAFSNWNLSLHNMFKEESLQWIGFDNFANLLNTDEFWKYLKNTLFFMMGIPLSIAGSLFAAMLLNSDLQVKDKKLRTHFIIVTLVIMGVSVACISGVDVSPFFYLITLLIGLFFIGGLFGGISVYRTLFYMPHFTAGVATFILWKKIFNPETGPLTQFLQPILNGIHSVAEPLPDSVFYFLMGLTYLFLGFVLYKGVNIIRKWREDEELGLGGLVLSFVFLSIPIFCIPSWIQWSNLGTALTIALFLIVFGSLLIGWNSFKTNAKSWDDGLGNAVMLSMGLMVLEFVLLGFGELMYNFPEMVAQGLNTPNWLTEYHWAKPSIMFMGFWASIGSNQMLLFLAALSAVSPELTEAAEIDGANNFQKFWNVTWPQLAPVTFFIMIMAVIHGMQGGFEVAKAMTNGGPAGATTTLEYYVYEEGFGGGRLAYASALSWILFCIIFAITLFQWRFGNRYVND